MIERKVRDNSRSLELIAGGLAGATSTVVTYPLEVLKTRLQSSTFRLGGLPLFYLGQNVNFNIASPVATVGEIPLVSYMRQMIKNEGYSLFSRGLAANIMAVSLSKAIYFPVYSCCKRILGQSDSAIVHSSSAATAGFVCTTLTNPVWFLKTRLQLDSGININKQNSFKVPIQIYQKEGIRVFYSGLAASYLGIVETVLQFVIYEYLRSRYVREQETSRMNPKYLSDCMLAGAISKTIATVIAYPHEVFRTRTREQENIGKSFVKLFREILKNEGWQTFYSGLGTHLVRQVPNSAILFLAYEAVIRYFGTR